MARAQADEQAAQELVLYTENTSNLWGPGNTQGEAIRKNLAAKAARGTLDPQKTPKLFEYLMESAAKQYAKEFASPSEWNKIFTKATRELAAKEIAENYFETYREELAALQPNSRAPLGYVHDAKTHDFLRPAPREDMLKSLRTSTGEYTEGGRRVYVRNGTPPPAPSMRQATQARRPPPPRRTGARKPLKSYKELIHESERDLYPFDYAVRNGSDEDFWLDELVLRGITLGFWLPAWADAVEEAGLPLPKNINEETAPEPPVEVEEFAKSFALKFMRLNPRTGALHEYATILGIDVKDEEELESFGYYLSMEAQGSGVSWADDHGYTLAAEYILPNVEFHVELEDPEDEDSGVVSWAKV
jgi:hypothetical protein